MKRIFLCIFFFHFCVAFSAEKTYLFLGTIIKIKIPSKEIPPETERFLKNLEKVFNYYDMNSEVSKINKNAGIQKTKVSKDLIECLKLALKIHHLTDGAFNVMLSPVIKIWKGLIKKKRVKKLPSKELILKKLKLTNIKDLLIDEKNNEVFLRKQGQEIDLGGIAKGFIVDKLAEFFRSKKINNFLIDAGGDIYCAGKNLNRKWKIAIRDPKDKYRYLKILELENKAIATSGNYEQFFEFENKRYHHIIDPKTGFPIANNLLSVSVIADNLSLADSLSTAFFVMGKDKIKEFLKKNSLNIQVYLVEEKNGELKIYYFRKKDLSPTHN